jgi:hypothetical protein
LVNGLPPEAATWRVDGQQWTTVHELLAALVERTDMWGLANARLKTGGKGLPNHPLRVPRPGEELRSLDADGSEKKDRVVSDPREIAAWFS